MASTDHEDAFLDEVLGLFVLEAQEWINQSNSALLELEHHPVSDRKHKLYETIVCGITNLGGSAATVELRDLEKLAFGLLPLLQTMQALNGSTTAVQLGALRDGFNGIIAAVQTLNDTKTGHVPNLEQILARVTEVAKQTVVAPQQTSQATPSTSPTSGSAVPPSPSIMDRLSEFQRQHVGQSDVTRHTVDTIVRKAKKDYGERGWRFVDAPTVIQLVQELDRSDDQFLNEVRKRLPTIGGIFADLTSPHAEMLLSNGRMEKLLQEVQALHDSARTFEAKPVMQFFHGLHSFLTILSQKAVDIAASRLEAVESRLKRIVPMAEEWAEAGKKERAAIQQLVRQ
jgi:chemotaxis protein histidine kinase CheA